MDDSKFYGMSWGEISEIRHDLVQLIKSLEEESGIFSRTKLAKRITQLCHNKTIPPMIMQYMHIIREARNMAEYEQWLPNKKESRVIRDVWDMIRDWKNNHDSSD